MTAVATSAALPNHSTVFRRRRFANWFPLGLTYATLYMGRYNFNVSKDDIAALYHLDKATSQTQMGVIASVGFWVYALSVLVNGPLADRLGGRRAILIGVFGSSVLNLAIGLALKSSLWDTHLIAGMSLFYGINMYFQSYGALSVVKVNAAWFHVRERGVLGGFFGSMISMGYWLALSVGAFIVSRLPIWCVYVIPSAVLLTMGTVDVFIVKNRPSDAGHHDFPTGDEEHDVADAAPEEKVPFWAVVRKVLANPVLRTLAAAEFCTGLVRQGLLLYFTGFLLKVHGVDKASGTYQMSSIGITLGGIAGALLCGWVSDRFFQSRRAPVAFLFYLGQIASLLVLGWVGSPLAAAMMVGVCAMWIFGVHGMLSGTASMDFGGKKAAATAAGLLDGVQYLGAGVVGIGLGWIIDHYQYGAWTYSLVPFSAIGGLLMLRLWNARPSKSAAH